METIDTGQQLINAFPVNKNTYEGVPTNKDTARGRYQILHMNASGAVDFTFDNNETLTVTLSVGENVALSSDIDSITSTVQVRLS